MTRTLIVISVNCFVTISILLAAAGQFKVVSFRVRTHILSGTLSSDDTGCLWTSSPSRMGPSLSFRTFEDRNHWHRLTNGPDNQWLRRIFGYHDGVWGVSGSLIIGQRRYGIRHWVHLVTAGIALVVLHRKRLRLKFVTDLFRWQ